MGDLGLSGLDDTAPAVCVVWVDGGPPAETDDHHITVTIIPIYFLNIY